MGAQMRVSIRTDMTTGQLSILGQGPDGSPLTTTTALAIVLSAMRELMILETMDRIKAESTIKVAGADALNGLPRIQG